MALPGPALKRSPDQIGGWSISRGLTAGFAAALGIMAVIGWYSNRNAIRMAYSSHWVTQTYRSITNIEGILAQIRTMESASRGFVVAGDEAFLESDSASKRQIEKFVSDLRAEAGENAGAKARLVSLESLIAEKLAFIDEVNETRRRDGEGKAAALVMTGRGKTLMDSIRRIGGEMRREQSDLLARRQIDAIGQAERILIADMAGSLASFLVLGFIFIRLNREIGERRRNESALREMTGVLENAVEGIARVGVGGRYETVNPAYSRLVGIHSEAFIGANWLEFIRPEDRPILQAAKERMMDDGKAEAEARAVSRSGADIFVQLTLLRDDDWRGRFAGHYCFMKDITERKRNEEALREAHGKLTGWVEELERRNSELWLLGELGDMLQTCSTEAEACQALARTAHKLFPNDSGALALIKEATGLAETAATWGAPRGAKAFAPDDCWAARRGGSHATRLPGGEPACAHFAEASPISALCVPLTVQAETIGVLQLEAPAGREAEGIGEAKLQLLAAVADQFALSLANMRLRESLRGLSIRDPLTGIYNRRFLEESFERELHRARRAGKPLGVIMLDIDHFKRFNDTFGHDAGDALLRELGAFLRQSVRGADIPCRYGGEEFTLILPEATLEITAQRAEEMRKGAQRLNIVHLGKPLGRISLSLGVAVFPAHGGAAEELLRAADGALYLAKSRGRDQVVVA